jgi:hypothetical protein
MDRSVSQAAVYEKSFSLACSNSDVNKKTFDSVQNREETWDVSTGNSRPELRVSEGAGETMFLLRSGNVKNEEVVSSFTQPTLSDASHESCEVEYEVPGLSAYSEDYWERAAYNWVVDSYKKECAQKSTENKLQEDMHGENAEVSDKEWRRMASMYGPSDLKDEIDEREEQFNQDYRNAFNSGDVKGFFEKYPDADPHIFLPA